MLKKLKVAIYFTGDFPEGGATVSRLKGYLNALKNQCALSINILWQDSFSNSGINKEVQGSWSNIPFKFHNQASTRPLNNLGKLTNTLKAFFYSSVHLINTRRKTDLIYIYNPEFHYFFHILLLAKFFKIPVVIEQTELQSSLYLQPGAKKNIFYYLKKWSENHMHYFSKSAVVISDKLYNHYLPTYNKNNLYKIPVLVDVLRFSPDTQNRKQYLIGYIGSFGVKDGIPGLLHAFKIATQEFPLLKLRMIGNYDEHPNVLKTIQSLNLESNVELTGRVSYEQVPILLNDCDLLICNRINSEYANYGFPSKLAEYMALEIPVISSNTGDISNYISSDNINLVAPDKIDELAACIISRYQHSAIFETKAKMAKQIVLNKFDSNICSQKLFQVFTNSIANKF